MIDWNNNGQIDPEEIVLTGVILSEEEDDERPAPKKIGGGCLMCLFMLPVLLIKALFLQ